MNEKLFTSPCGTNFIPDLTDDWLREKALLAMSSNKLGHVC